jgi:hypothetical protein
LLQKFWKFILTMLRFLIALIKSILGFKNRAPCPCSKAPAIKKPDPFLYCQYFLMALGFPVTWDNPDIWVYEGLVMVDPHQLKASTKYTVVARVWNGSFFVPVFHLNVAFSYLSFGMGTQSHPIGTSWTDLGVVGLANWPAFATIDWITPATLGHYCIQVLLEPPDDSNWLNNLGQRNVFITQPQSPANFSFAVGNHVGPRVRNVRFILDSYSIPPLPDCSDRDSKIGRKREISKVAPPVPDGWTVVLTPETLHLAQGEEQQVQAQITPPPGFSGSMPVNVTGWDDNGPVGGVTLTVEVP